MKNRNRINIGIAYWFLINLVLIVRKSLVPVLVSTAEPFERHLLVFERERIDLGERELKVVHVPGHTPGSTTLLDRTKCQATGSKTAS